MGLIALAVFLALAGFIALAGTRRLPIRSRNRMGVDPPPDDWGAD